MKPDTCPECGHLAVHCGIHREWLTAWDEDGLPWPLHATHGTEALALDHKAELEQAGKTAWVVRATDAPQKPRKAPRSHEHPQTCPDTHPAPRQAAETQKPGDPE